jgi:ATP-dependent RNA circularization protein (DNA/RNA ligase family)
VRFEPRSLNLVNAYPTIKMSFEQDGCMSFCEKVQGYNVQLTKQFDLNFKGVSTTIARIIFPVSEDTISTATEILM